MQLFLDAVNEFYKKLPRDNKPVKWSPSDPEILALGQRLIEASKTLEKRLSSDVGDVLALRTHLACEELGEMLVAEDEVTAFDGCVDRLYVLLGDFLVYDWPAIEGFAEVHRSNMTKVSQPSDPARNRLREKGPDYSPPDMKRVLDEHRAQGHRRRTINESRDMSELFLGPCVRLEQTPDATERALLEAAGRAMAWSTDMRRDVMNKLDEIRVTLENEEQKCQGTRE